MMSEYGICPKCKKKTNYVDYTRTSSNNGHYKSNDIWEENHDYEDDTEEIDFFCPNCDEKLDYEQADIEEFFDCEDDESVMKVELVNARDVFDDDNNGLIYGLQEINDCGCIGDYVEWFATEEERKEAMKKATW